MSCGAHTEHEFKSGAVYSVFISSLDHFESFLNKSMIAMANDPNEGTQTIVFLYYIHYLMTTKTRTQTYADVI